MAQTRSVTIQLKEMEEDRDRTEARLQKLQRSLGKHNTHSLTHLSITHM